MNIHQTDINGVYVGTTAADQDPLDSNNWLIPAGCVKTAPPTITDKQFAKWDGAKWDLENIPVVEPDTEPTLAEKSRSERDAKLVATDWMANSDVTMSDEWRTYRQLLRDVPSQEFFPETVNWPVVPS